MQLGLTAAAEQLNTCLLWFPKWDWHISSVKIGGRQSSLYKLHKYYPSLMSSTSERRRSKIINHGIFIWPFFGQYHKAETISFILETWFMPYYSTRMKNNENTPSFHLSSWKLNWYFSKMSKNEFTIIYS